MALSKRSTNPTAKTPARRGRVFVRGHGNFFGQGEELSFDHPQLPQLLPRTEWPDDPDVGRDNRPPGKYHGPTFDWDRDLTNVSNEQARIRLRVDQGYPQLQPMPPFNYHAAALPTYNDSIWQDHVAILHGLLYSTLKNRQWLDADEIVELLTCVSYGMNRSMAWLPPWLIQGPPYGRQGGQMPFEAGLDPDFGLYMKLGAFTYGTSNPTPDDFKLRILGRRWLVVPINQVEAHWSVSIFDRKEGHLYIFDSTLHSRDQRVEATVHQWARFWNFLGMPWHFQYFVPSVTLQSEGWECGPLAIHWLIMALRNRVGRKMLASNLDIRTDDFILYGNSPDTHDYPLVDSSLHLPDWLPRGCETSSSGLKAVTRILAVLICNELGLSTNQDFKRVDGKSSESPYDRLVGTSGNIARTSGPRHMEAFFTGHGGPQFVLPLTSRLRPYNLEDERNNHPERGSLEGTIETRSQELAIEPQAALQTGTIQWPRNHVNDAGNDIVVHGLQQNDEAATETNYPVHVQLKDLQKPSRNIPPLVVRIKNWKHGRAPNGTIDMRFHMGAGFDNQATLVQDVQLFLPVENEIQPNNPNNILQSTDSSNQTTSGDGDASVRDTSDEPSGGNANDSSPRDDDSAMLNTSSESDASRSSPGPSSRGIKREPSTSENGGESCSSASANRRVKRRRTGSNDGS